MVAMKINGHFDYIFSPCAHETGLPKQLLNH